MGRRGAPLAAHARDKSAGGPAYTLGARALSLAGLWSLAVAQPVLGGLSAGFLIAQGAGPLDVVIFGLVIIVLPPLLLLALEQLAGRVRRTAMAPLHLLLVGILAGATISQFFYPTLGFSPRMLVWIGTGAMAAFLYGRLPPVRTFASALSVAAVFMLVSFLLAGPTSKLVLPVDTPVAKAATRDAATPVVLVIFDELPGPTIMGPDRRVDRRLFPNFARLARNATWYPNASTVHNLTQLALPALFTGRVAQHDSEPADWDHPKSLFTLLGDRYDMHVSEPYTGVCPRALCDVEAGTRFGRLKVLGQTASYLGLQRLAPSAIHQRVVRPPQWRDLDVPKQVSRFQRTVGQGRRPGLYMLHVVAPHRPWRYLATGQQYPLGAEQNAGWERPLGGQSAENTILEEWPVVQQYQRHVIQAQYTDRVLGQVMRKLKAEGLWDKAAVVVTSDHGQTIRPGQPLRARVTDANLPDVMTVPLFVKAPGQQGGRVSQRFAQTIDVMPTLADLAGVRVPWKVDGRSLTKPAPERRKLVLHKVSTGEATRIDAPEFRRRILEDVAPRSFLLAAERRGLDAYGMGPRPALLGKRVGGGLSWKGGASVRLQSPRTLPPLDRKANVLPVRLVGQVKGIKAGREMAVAVNGRIVATTKTYRSHDGPGTSVTAMLSPKQVRKGGTVSLLAIEGPAGSPRLRQVRLSG